jgi:threonine/homoserine/homoserine lactone efflux protein
MALSAITLYATGRDLASVLWVAGVYVAVSMVSTTSWTLLGQQLRRLLKNQTRLRIFNWIMASLLIATLIPVLWPT